MILYLYHVELQATYDAAHLLKFVPYVQVPIEVYNGLDGGPRPRASLDERYKQTQFKVGDQVFLSSS